MKAIRNHIIVRELKEDNITEHGIITELKKNDKRRVAETVSEGEINFKTNMRDVKKIIKPGTKVFIELYAGKNFHHEGEDLKLIHCNEIKAFWAE